MQLSGVCNAITMFILIIVCPGIFRGFFICYNAEGIKAIFFNN